MPKVVVGSKAFTESVILGDLIAYLARDAGAQVQHKQQLGGSPVLWHALQKGGNAGGIDIYPEYTGTLSQEILAGSGLRSDEAIRKALAKQHILMSQPLGFNDAYGIGMKETEVDKRGIRTISDLRPYPELKFGFSNEFMERKDGWPNLRARYGLPHRDVRGLDHMLAYRALDSGAIDATDVYSTDPEIKYHGLRVLEDDLQYFPKYYAVLLYREDLKERAPEVVQAVLKLEGRIPLAAMIEMNERAKPRVGKRVPEKRVAADFLAQNPFFKKPSEEVEAQRPSDESLAEVLWRHTLQHLWLVAVSLAAAIVISIPLGVLAARFAASAQAILGFVGIIQTIPSLALLVFFIPWFGLGAKPAIVALFLYSLLPIVRNTFTGLHDIPGHIRESAQALGLPPGARLRLVELPMAARSILAGIKTSAVINVGTATLGGIIGAGGYGEIIMAGVRLDSPRLILEGAIPAALLALLVQGLFEWAERGLVPKGLRLRTEQ